MRYGFSKLNNQLPSGQWAIIGDVTVDIGTLKCLATVGVNLDTLYERTDIILTYNDLEIIGIHPTHNSTGEFAHESFQKDIERLGGARNVKQLLIDQGSDLTKGAKLIKQAEMRIKCLHDISHLLANVLEKDLKEDSLWEEYTKHLTETKRLVQQTEVAALQPPKQRSKSRFMNCSLYIDWFIKLEESKKNGNLDYIPQERYNEFFGWRSGFEFYFEILQQKAEVIEFIKDTIRRSGYSMNIYDHLIDTLDLMPYDEAVRPLICKALDVVFVEVEKLDENERLLGSTEIMESLFGSYKNHSARGGHGITGNILTLGVLVGKVQTGDELCKTMEMNPVQAAVKWVEDKIGDTLAKLRNAFFKKPRNGQNLTSDCDVASAVG